MYIVLIGAPGAGKGTQAVSLAEDLGLAHVATGDMFRNAFERGSPLGRQAKLYMDRGELVPDEVTAGMVAERLNEPDASSGAILDGFPRNLAQAEALHVAFGGEARRVDQAIYLTVPESELLRRLSGRWLCRTCQASYHEVFNPPSVAGVCDRCGGELYQRPDDTIDTAKRRLTVYFEQTLPVVGYYREAGILDEVDGDQAIPEVKEALFRAIRGRLARI